VSGAVTASGNVIVSNVTSPVQVYGNVGVSSVYGTVNANVLNTVAVSGAVTASGNVIVSNVTSTVNTNVLNSIIGNVNVANVVNPVQVYGNVIVSNVASTVNTNVLNSIIGNVNVSNVINPVQVYGNVIVSNVTSPVQVYGNVGISSNVTLSGSLSISNVQNPVQVYGNVIISNVTSTVNANVTNSIIGNVNVSNIINPVQVYGNIIVSNVTSNIIVASVTKAITVSTITNYDDGLGRLRVLNPSTVQQCRYVTAATDILMTSSNTAGCNVLYDPILGIPSLYTGNIVGHVYRQAKHRGICLPGRVINTGLTFVLAKPKNANSIQQVGYFDDNDGIFLRYYGNSVPAIVRRSNLGTITEEIVTQSNWNSDKLDGTGPSGVTANFDNIQFLYTTMNWPMDARLGFSYGPNVITAHRFIGVEKLNEPIIANPNLPIRWEMINSNNMVMSMPSGSTSIDTGYAAGFFNEHASTFNTGTISSGATQEVSAFRIKASDVKHSIAYISKMIARVSSTTAGICQWYIVMNPTVTSAGTWSSLAEDSVIERNTTRTVNAGNLSGILVASGFMTYNSTDPVYDQGDRINMLTFIGAYANGVSDVLSVQVNNVDNANRTCTINTYIREFS
jgi:hypothetical protein